MEPADVWDDGYFWVVALFWKENQSNMGVGQQLWNCPTGFPFVFQLSINLRAIENPAGEISILNRLDLWIFKQCALSLIEVAVHFIRRWEAGATPAVVHKLTVTILHMQMRLLCINRPLDAEKIDEMISSFWFVYFSFTSTIRIKTLDFSLFNALILCIPSAC